MDLLSELHRNIHDLLETHGDLPLIGHDAKTGAEFVVSRIEFNIDLNEAVALLVANDDEEKS